MCLPHGYFKHHSNQVNVADLGFVILLYPLLVLSIAEHYGMSFPHHFNYGLDWHISSPSTFHY